MKTGWLNEEVERLKSELNGRTCVYRGDDDVWDGADCIILCPPDGAILSVKPFGYTPEELLEYCNGNRSLDHVSQREFCFASIKMFLATPEQNIEILTTILNMVNNENKYDLGILMDKFAPDNKTGHSECPY